MNRLTKILSAIALASAVSTGMVVVAGCNGCNQPETPPSPPPEEHVHTYSPDWSFDGQKHWHAATCEHTDLKSDEAAHADANNDGVCDVCGYDEMPIAPYNVGIEMNKTVTEYVLDGTATAAISLDDISVNLVRSDGADAGALEDYTLKCYKGQTELTEEQMAAAGEGAYNIWAEAEIDSNGTTVKVDSFVVVYVVDEIVSLSFDAEAAGTVTTQQTSVTDEMSATWNFKATFKSGEVRTLTAEDVEIENLNTTSAIDEGVANISYVYTNAKGEDKEVETTVNYTVTSASASQTNNYSMDLNLLNGKADKTKLTAADMTDANAFLNIAEGANVVARTNSAGDTVTSIETKGEGMSVTFAGTGSITISFCSTGGSNTSELGLKDPSGTLLVAANDADIAAANKESTGLYIATGTASGAVSVTYDITTSGEYTICTAVTENESTGKAKYDRAARLLEVEMTEIVGGGGEAVTNSYSFSYDELTAALTEINGAVPTDKTALKAEAFTGSNAFITFLTDGSGSSDQYRTSGGCIEIKNQRLQVTFLGTGSISVKVSSTGGSNTSRFGILNSAGEYIAASDFAGAKLVSEGDEAGTYEFTGTSYIVITFEVTEAGTYTLSSPSSVTTRGCRIQGIEMTNIHQ